MVLGSDTTKPIKPCKKCGGTDRYAQKHDRKIGQCKTCEANRYKNNKDKIKNNVEQWRKNNLDKRKIISSRYKQKNKEKIQAHNKVQYAIKRGDLPKVSTCACADCSIEAQEYHHEDYSKPLEVVPLCRECHIKRHA